MAKEGSTRREFIAGLAGGILGMGARREASAQPEGEVHKEIESALLLQNEKIDYRGPYKEVTPEVSAIISELANLHGSERDLRQGTQTRGVSEDVISTVHDRVKKLWPRLETLVPNLPQFSRAAYFKVFFYEVPKALARYGVNTDVAPMPQFNLTINSVDNMNFAYSFNKIEKVHSDTVRADNGQTVPRDVVYVTDSYEINGQDVNVRHLDSTGNTAHQTIFLRINKLASDFANIQEQTRLFSTEKYNISTEHAKQRLAGAADAEAKAWMLSAVRLYRSINPESLTQAHTDNSSIAHETGHLLSEANPKFVAETAIKNTSNVRNAIGALGNHMAHDEAEGFMGALDFGENKQLVLIDVMMCGIGGKSGEDYGHSRGAQWVRDAIATELCAHPDDYGLTLAPGDTVGKRVDAIFQIESLARQPELVRLLAKRIKAYHAQHYTDNLGEEYIAAENIDEKLAAAKTERQEYEQFDMYKKLGAAGVGALGAAAGVAWLFNRRQQVAAQKDADEKPKKRK